MRLHENWLDHPKRAPEKASLSLLSLLAACHHPEELDWMTQGSCASSDHPEFWFPSKGRKHLETHAAIRVCGRCPVRAECLSYAVDAHAHGDALHGIWAGTTPEQRRALAKQVAAS